jgi:hypothetical protein
MKSALLNITVRLAISLLIFIIVMFFVAWLLEDVIFFSLFIGIPAGFISAAVAFAVLSWYYAKK